MTLEEFDKIRPYLPKGTIISIDLAHDEDQTAVVSVPVKWIEEYWGNHDGRYNVKCPKCGWTSKDIHRGEYRLDHCPKCGWGPRA